MERRGGSHFKRGGDGGEVHFKRGGGGFTSKKEGLSLQKMEMKGVFHIKRGEEKVFFFTSTQGEGGSHFQAGRRVSHFKQGRRGGGFLLDKKQAEGVLDSKGGDLNAVQVRSTVPMNCCIV